MTERRYSEDEVAQIFERATEEQKSSLQVSRTGEGLTIAELQEVGREVGVPPELIERAARSLDLEGGGQGRSLLGLPVGVGHTIELERKLTDAEWHRLVADLRETFDARGTLSEQGPFKQWTNGNLQALLEPTPTGQRLRLRTRRGSAMSMMVGSTVTLGMAGAVAIAGATAGDLAGAFPGIAAMVTVGLGMLGGALAPLPAWARLRRRQMQEIAERVMVTTSTPAEDSPKRNPGSS